MSFQLSKGALDIIMNGGSVPNPILQVLGSKKLASPTNYERFRVLVSDSDLKVNSAIYTIQTRNSSEECSAMELYTIIKLKSYSSNVMKNQDKRVLIIYELEVLEMGKHIGHQIGNPINFFGSSSNTQTSDDLDSTVRTSIPAFNQKNLKYSSDEISPIPSLNPFHNNWTIKARVISKTNIRNWSNERGEGKLFSVDLKDKWGEIRCTTFRDLVDKFYDLLEVDKVYIIGKCLLKPKNPTFCSLNHHFEMTFTAASTIQEVANDLTIPQIKYNFVTIDKIRAMVPNTAVDLVAICKSFSKLVEFTSRLTNRELKKREILLVDQSKAAISLVLWGDKAEHFEIPEHSVISLRNARIQEFQGTKSLNLGIGSQLDINPNIPEKQELYNWYEREGYQLEFQNISARSLSAGTFPWCNLTDIKDQDLSESFSFQTYATILYARLDRCVYQSCPTADCQKKVVDLENGMYKCEKCNREYPNFKYRLLFSMNISDWSGSQWVTVFSTEAEMLLGMSADEAGRAIANNPDIVSEYSEKLQFLQYVFKCRAKIESYNDEQKIRVMVVGMKNIDYQEHNNYYIKLVENFTGITFN